MPDSIPDFSRFRGAVFDFDGTVSLLTEGWQDVMQNLFEETLFKFVPFSGEEAEAERKNISRFIFEMTGKPSIFQCIRMAEEVVNCGGPKLDSQALHEEFSRRLGNRIEEREKAIQAGKIPGDEHMVPGARAFLERMKSWGLSMMLVSGTEDPIVQRQCRLLGLNDFFDGGIFGSPTDVHHFSKQAVIQQFMDQFGLKPAEVVGFGDGFVETRFIHEIGGFAVGMATREHERDGQINEWKRDQLLSVGADYIAPDFEVFL